MLSRSVVGFTRQLSLVLLFGVNCALSFAQSLDRGADALLAIDQHRGSVVEGIVATWGVPLAQSSAHVSMDELRARLQGLRADRLLAVSLAGTLNGVREIIGAGSAPAATAKPGLLQAKAFGDTGDDVAYTPVTPCRLVETRGTFAAVYQGDGTPAHTPVPFAPGEIRSYTVQGGNGACLTQLPAALNPAAVQLQVFGMPTTAASGDIEILPQGSSFGSTATMVYVGSIAFNTVSTAARINLANNQISVQVRGGGAHLAIDVVGYFRRPGNYRGNHTVTGTGATDGGGEGNVVTGAWATVAGGSANTASDGWATVAGGAGNTASGTLATVAGGGDNVASGTLATVAGGGDNVASGHASAVIGGVTNLAQGTYAVAAGHEANAVHSRSFVWNGWASGSATSFRENAFQMHGESGLSIEFGARRPDGGGTSWVFIGNGFVGQTITTSTGAFLSSAGVWVPGSSSKASKTDFAPVDGQEVLAQVARLPITTWRYKEGEGEVRHMGPMAEDFDAAFGVGYGPQTIADLDARGVALAAIQGLNVKLEERIGEQQREIADLRERVSATEGVRAELALIKAMLAELQRSRAAVAAY